MGWNDLSFHQEVPLYKDVKPNDYVYFVHSYYVACDDPSIIATTTNYDGVEFCSSIVKATSLAFSSIRKRAKASACRF